MNNISKIFLIGLLIIGFIACQDDLPNMQSVPHQPELPAQHFDYMQVMDQVAETFIPGTIDVDFGEEIFINNENIFGNVNVRTTVSSDAMATLGRVLFYDNRLSKNNSISCASCHKQNKAFSDDVALSQGFGGKLTKRNSMSIVNPILNSTFFWDGRSSSLHDLALRPVLDHIEMGIDNTTELVNKLRAESYYPDLFKDAFGDERIDHNRTAQAISEFVASMFAHDSRFDEGIENNFAEMSELEKHGMALFFSNETQCSSCHSGPNFASPTSSFNNPYEETGGTTNIGLDVVYDDPGFSDGKFKIPSLRNIALTGPYMHDGRFDDLHAVIEHYNNNIQPHTDLDSKLTNGGSPVTMSLTSLDVDALAAFLGTLTSKSLMTEERYSNPFKS